MTVQCSRAQRSEDLLLAAMSQAGASPREMAHIRQSFSNRLARTRGGRDLSWADRQTMWIHAACDATKNTTFAARLGLALRRDGNLVEYIGRNARDLRSAIEDTAHLHRLDSPALSWSLQESGDEARMVFVWRDAKHVADHRLVEFAVFTALARIRVATRAVVTPIEIRFTHRVAVDAGRYRQVAACPVVFGSDEIALVFSQTAIDTPIPTHDPDLHAHLTGYGLRLLAEEALEPSPLRARVENVLTEALPNHMPAVEKVAEELGMSTRTLHRRLLREGISFRDIVGELRNNLAKSLIKDEVRINEIAYALGYSDQSSFTTAFRRWNGMSPRQFRVSREEQCAANPSDVAVRPTAQKGSRILQMPVRRFG